MELRWRTSFSASCFHAAAAIAGGLSILPTELDAALREPAAQLERFVKGLGDREDLFRTHLIAQAALIDSNSQLAQTLLVKTLGRNLAEPSRVQRLTGLIADVESAVLRTLPQLEEQLAHRVRPLREQWEARGPGLLKRVGELIDAALLVEEAEVIVVHPACGGGGAPHPLYNSVRIEGVLANPNPALPEPLRLGWALCQLQCDLPLFSERIPQQRREFTYRWALLPGLLKAGADVEMLPGTVSLATAAEAWGLTAPTQTVAAAADAVNYWWKTYLDKKPAWSVALPALDRILAGEA